MKRVHFPRWAEVLETADLLKAGTEIRTVPDLLGHKSVETTQVYLHVMQKPGAGVRSPLDSL